MGILVGGCDGVFDVVFEGSSDGVMVGMFVGLVEGDKVDMRKNLNLTDLIMKEIAEYSIGVVENCKSCRTEFCRLGETVKDSSKLSLPEYKSYNFCDKCVEKISFFECDHCGHCAYDEGLDINVCSKCFDAEESLDDYNHSAFDDEEEYYDRDDMYMDSGNDKLYGDYDDWEDYYDSIYG